MQNKASSTSRKVFVFFNDLFFILLALLCVYPLWYVLVQSLSSGNTGNAVLFPENFTFNNYIQVFQMKNVAHAMGYSAINQSVDSLDWKDYGMDSIIRTVCEHKNLENGSIILLHNGSTYTKDALDVMLTNLEQQGYSFTPLSSLIYTSNYYLDHTGKQFLKK